MLRLETPEFLYLLSVIPLLVVIYMIYRRIQSLLIARFGDISLLSPLMQGYAPRRVTIKFVLLLVSLSLIILALARPQAGSRISEIKHNGGSIMLVVDVSRSMLAEDFAPNRLERTKYAIGQLLEKLTDQQIGIVVFAGDAYVQLPITADYMSARHFVRSLNTDMITRQGTSLQRAIDVALLAMPKSEGEKQDNSQTMVIITDGESHDDDPITAAKAAADQGVIIHTIGIGTLQGAPITIDGEIVKDNQGEIVVSKLDENTLNEIAAIGDGVYVRSSENSIGLDEILTHIQKMETEQSSTKIFDQYADQYHYLLYIALGLLVLQFFLPNDKRRV